MAGGVDNLTIQRTPRNFPFFQGLGLEGLQVHTEAHALANEHTTLEPILEANDGDKARSFRKFGTAEAMVNMQVRESNGTQVELLFGKNIEYGGGIVGRIENDGIRTVMDNMAIRFKSAERQGDDRHESLL
jgi:hypothetical protein